MKKWLKQSLLLCLLAALLSSSVFAADTESGICDLNSHNGYQLTAVGTPVTVDGKRVYPGTQTLSLTCDNPAAGENLLLVQTDKVSPSRKILFTSTRKPARRILRSARAVSRTALHTMFTSQTILVKRLPAHFRITTRSHTL